MSEIIGKKIKYLNPFLYEINKDDKIFNTRYIEIINVKIIITFSNINDNRPVINMETKKINDPRACQDFVSGLRDRVEMKGYSTPQIEQLLDYLNKNCPTFTEQTRINLGQQVIALSLNRETPLQCLYVIGNLLNGFSFTPEDLEIVGENILSFLREIYRYNFYKSLLRKKIYFLQLSLNLQE